MNIDKDYEDILGKIEIKGRITSYNVCYTKLLRPSTGAA